MAARRRRSDVDNFTKATGATGGRQQGQEDSLKRAPLIAAQRSRMGTRQRLRIGGVVKLAADGAKPNHLHHYPDSQPLSIAHDNGSTSCKY